MGWDIACQNILKCPFTDGLHIFGKSEFNSEQTYIGFLSLSNLLQVIMHRRTPLDGLFLKNHNLASWNDFQRRQTEVQLVMATVYSCFNFSIWSPMIFVYLSNKAFKFNCSSLEQPAHTNKFAPHVFTKEWQRPR